MICPQARAPSLGEGRGGCLSLSLGEFRAGVGISPSFGGGWGEAPYFTTFLVVPSLIFRIFIPGSMWLRRLPSVP